MGGTLAGAGGIIQSNTCMKYSAAGRNNTTGLLPRRVLSEGVYPGRDPPASGQEPPSNPIFTLNGRQQS